MDLEELRAFLAVVETGSFLGAERNLKMPRATVRRRVDALEARAGVSLIMKTREGVAATEAGAVLAHRGRQMIQEATALVASIREIGQEPSGVLRVMLPVGLAPHALVPAFDAVREAYPRLSVHARFSSDPVSGLLDDVDVALHFGPRATEGPWLSFELLRMQEHLIAHPSYLARRGTPTSLESLRQHTLFAWESPGEDPRVWPLRSGATFTVEPRLIASDIHLLRQCVLAGLGMALLPDAMLPDPGADSEGIVQVMATEVGRERSLRAVVPTVLSEVPKVKAVLSHIRAFAKQL